MRAMDEGELLSTLSHGRLASYFEAADQDRSLALSLYEWNIRISGAFYELLGDVEVVIRNAIHKEMMAFSVREGHGPNWFDNGSGMLHQHLLDQLSRSRQSVVRSRNTATPDDLVESLPFGFWRYLLTNRFRTTLWPQAIRFGFPNCQPKEAERLFAQVGRLHQLRNRIAHHRPIYFRRLDLDLVDSYAVIGAVSRTVEGWSRSRSRVESLIPLDPRKT